MNTIKQMIFAFLTTLIFISWLSIFVKNKRSRKIVRPVIGAYIVVLILSFVGRASLEATRQDDFKDVFLPQNASDSMAKTYKAMTEELLTEMLADKGYSVNSIEAKITIKDTSSIYCSKVLIDTNESDLEGITSLIFNYCGVYPDYG